MRLLNWAMGLVNQLLFWVIRPPNLGIALLSRSSCVLLALCGGVTIEAKGVADFVDYIKYAPSEGLPGSLQTIVFYLACATWIIGLFIILWTQYRSWKEADTRRIVVVEMRGLVDTSDRPLLTAIPVTLLGRRVDCIVDVRKHLAAPTPNIEEALKEIEHIQREVRRARGGTAPAEVQVVAGGVMQVPLLFFAGTLLDDEGNVLLMEWERTKGDWKQLSDPADGKTFEITGLDGFGTSKEVVLAISASYSAAYKDIAITFPGIPIVRMALVNPQPNTLWSADTQEALTQQFIQTLGTLANKEVEIVHLILVAPASLAIRFGQAYDHRNMPKLRCYQHEKNQSPPYPWSIQMPTAPQSVVCVQTLPTITT